MKTLGGIGALGVRRPHAYPDQLTVAGLIARLVELPPDRPVFVMAGPAGRRAATAVVETQSIGKKSPGFVEVEIR